MNIVPQKKLSYSKYKLPFQFKDPTTESEKLIKNGFDESQPAPKLVKIIRFL